MDEDVLRLGKLTWEGALPSTSDDVMLERAYLSKINTKADIGDTITLDIGNGGKQYHITGFIQYGAKSEDATSFNIIRSKDSFTADDVTRGAVYVRLSNSSNLSADSLEKAIYDIAGHYDIPRKNVKTNSSYFNAIEPISIGNLLAIIGVAAMIGLASALVIYSIFYISVTGKVREYGQLRTIGTTNANPEKKANVETELRAIVASDSSFHLKVLDDLIAEKEIEFQTMSFILYSIVLVIAFFGIISLINTVVTNVLSRRQELGVLQAIGLSNKQLNQMLQSEGMIYTLGTVTATLTVGTGLGWLLCKGIRRFSEVPYIDYHFPLIPALLFLAVFLLIQISISFASSRGIKKQSLVERMREA